MTTYFIENQLKSLYIQTDLSNQVFPSSCPYSLEELLDINWLSKVLRQQ